MVYDQWTNFSILCLIQTGSLKFYFCDFVDCHTNCKKTNYTVILNLDEFAKL